MNARIKPLPVERSKLANALRFLAIDAVEAAKSGHPGMPMGMADIAEVLWRRFLKHNPADPHWPDRDRFMLSNGHGSMLLYSLCTSPATRCRWRSSSAFVSCTARLPVTPKST